MRRFFADRSLYLGDPEFYKVPQTGLLDTAYIAKSRASIYPSRAINGQLGYRHPSGSESSETTHYDVVDAEGNAVSVPYTLNGGFGNGITVPGLGFPSQQRDGRFRG